MTSLVIPFKTVQCMSYFHHTRCEWSRFPCSNWNYLAFVLYCDLYVHSAAHYHCSLRCFLGTLISCDDQTSKRFLVRVIYMTITRSRTKSARTLNNASTRDPFHLRIIHQPLYQPMPHVYVLYIFRLKLAAMTLRRQASITISFRVKMHVPHCHRLLLHLLYYVTWYLIFLMFHFVLVTWLFLM